MLLNSLKFGKLLWAAHKMTFPVTFTNIEQTNTAINCLKSKQGYVQKNETYHMFITESHICW